MYTAVYTSGPVFVLPLLQADVGVSPTVIVCLHSLSRKLQATSAAKRNEQDGSFPEKALGESSNEANLDEESQNCFSHGQARIGIAQRDRLGKKASSMKTAHT